MSWAGLIDWTCRCGEQGYAPSLITAFREWRVHHNSQHGGTLTSEQLQAAVEGKPAAA